MVLTSNNSLQKYPADKFSVFLAGSIGLTTADKWRSSLINSLGQEDYHFFDPTHSEHDQLANEEMRAHIRWELETMEHADCILLNFLPNAQSPISLVELGIYVRSNKLIVICPREFYKWRYVDVLCKQYQTPIYSTLQDAITQLNLQKRTHEG